MLKRQSDEINHLASALAQARLEIKNPEVNSSGHRSEYADLEHVLSLVNPLLNKNGIYLHQGTDIIEGSTCLITTLMHSSGQFIKSVFPLVVDFDKTKGTRVQQEGGAQTYHRRYQIFAALGIFNGKDSDGEEFVDKDQKMLLEDMVKNHPSSKQIWSNIKSFNKIESFSDLPSYKFQDVVNYIKNFR